MHATNSIRSPQSALASNTDGRIHQSKFVDSHGLGTPWSGIIDDLSGLQ
jgi:hypothetical protein